MANPNRHTLVLLLFFMLSLVVIFPNTILYTVVLLALVFCLASFMVSVSSLNALVAIILILVYVGAIMILVGYICAVSPNIITSLNTSVTPFLLAFVILSCILGDHFHLVTSQTFPSSYFYADGVILFSSIVLMLFVTLLIVTSQYSSPRGPFRSL